MVKTIDSLDQLLTHAKTVGIAGHVRPDGDCVGSTLAVYNYVKTYYPEIEAHIFLEPIPNIFKFLQNADQIDSSYEYEGIFDLFFSLDCGDTGRLGKAADFLAQAKVSACVDHHVNKGLFADYNYIIPDASSACELVFDLMPVDRITKEIAECLYTGMVHDTGVFQYSCTTAKTMNVAGVLMEKGIDYPKIVDETFYTKTYAQNRILGHALLKSQLHCDGQVISSVITRQEMEEFGVLPKHLDGIVSQLRITKGVKVALFCYQNEDGSFKGSLRANGDFDVAKIAMQFGGGGHVKAAGLSMDASGEETVSRVVEAIAKEL